ncbi:unnamed protein product [Taenia asiatica]|uniref:Uncharacterized protein n=1 Tax=Taenia asiatica TaxID=60517 RepID=A0A0R3VT47_TAEAS|nr:unnamed protein product [Taenia asiatica]
MASVATTVPQITRFQIFSNIYELKIFMHNLQIVSFVPIAALEPDPEFAMTFKNLFDSISFRSFAQLQGQFARFYEFLSRSKMINCPSRINFIYENGFLKLLNYNLRHNHLLSPVAILRDESRNTVSKRRFHLRHPSSKLEDKVSPELTSNTLWHTGQALIAESPGQIGPFVGVPSGLPLHSSKLRQLMSEMRDRTC